MRQEYKARLDKVSEPIVQYCDQLLHEYKDHGIAVMGTGGRGLYSTMRTLVQLPDRGNRNRVQLFDISTKLLLGEKGYDSYMMKYAFTVPTSHTHEPRIEHREPDREEKIFQYLKNSGLLDHEHVALVDVGFSGSVISHVKRIIEEKMPEKKGKIDLVLWCAAPGSSVPQWKRVNKSHALEIAKALEYESYLPLKSRVRILGEQGEPVKNSPVSVGFGFTEKNGKPYPKYQRTNPESRQLARIQAQVLRQKATEYMEMVKTDYRNSLGSLHKAPKPKPPTTRKRT
ncbi:hypothetical protein HY994_01715 [Candidatus Micrarchaeota archaeon]|nr:hypothetical protein [Candidatus Micrarchaeota archaeon]